MSSTYAPDARRRFLLDTALTIGAVYTGVTAYPFLASMAPGEAAKAAGAPVEVGFANLAPGELLTAGWRGKPVWILRRTREMLAGLTGHDQLLADPGSHDSAQPADCLNAGRSERPDVFVCLGVCTHLGCSPTLRVDPAARADLGSNWPGGFFCPCHGSKFDLAGRVFKNVPAPTNLEVPPYRYLNDTRVMIGEAEKAQ
jgi:ubiquinol-cytochrome c reductase iron-sulfur subunit